MSDVTKLPGDALKVEANGCRMAAGIVPVLCPCGCNHVRFFLLNGRDEVFAYASLQIELVDRFARDLLSQVEKGRTMAAHGVVGHG